MPFRITGRMGHRVGGATGQAGTSGAQYRYAGLRRVTDYEWYRFLAVRPEISETEVNSGVVGGGFYSGFAPLRVSEAWRLFGPANGADSLERMRA
jgi:hypothetical protein